MPVTPAVGETRPSAPAESTADARLAIPSDEQQVKAFASINEVFDFAAAEAPPQQLKIAGELLAFGKKSQNNPAEKFVLLREAMRLAKAGGDARLMLQAIDEIGGDFEIDAPAVRQKMLIGFADEARQAESIRSLVEVFEEFADQALEEQRFEAAAEAAAAVYAAVQRAPGSKYRKEVYDRRKQIVQLYENWQEIQSALAAVKTNPDDAAANLKLGRWYCFEQRDWRAGLPYLAKGSDAQLQSLAKLELDSPAGDADAQLALADAWYAAAETAPREAKTALLARSGHWYQQAQGSFTSPVVKLKIEKRLEEIGQLLTLDSPAVASPTLPVAATPDGPIAVALKYRATLSGHTHTVHGIEFSPDGKALLTFCKDRSVRLWDLAAGRPLKTLSTNLQDFSRGRMSADGQAIAAANLDHSISVWKADSPAPMILRGHTGPVTCVAFSGDGKTIASASEDGTAKLWEVKTGKGLKSFADSDGGKLKSVALSSDGKTLLTAMDVLKTVKRWDVDSGEVAFTIKTGSNNFDVVFGPQEKHIISISYNHPLQIWNAENGELVAALSGHPGYPRAARVSPDGRLLAEARHEGTIRIWDLTTYKELTSTPGHDQAFEAAFSPDGKTLASGGHDQIVKLWDVEVTPLTSKAE
jgi:WD40 repeat protein